MPEVEQAPHLGIIKTTTMKHNIQTNVDENITKARRSAYSLFGCGFHEHNGLDPESLLHIYKTYITPVLLYGMELLLPSSKPLEQLELFQKRILKQILSLPMWIATLFFGCNSYPSRFAKSRAMLTMICASLS
jgi:hypothetical protein